MNRSLLMCGIVLLLILTAFSRQESVVQRATLEDGTSIPIPADVLKRFKNAKLLSDFNSTDVDGTFEDKIDIKHLLHKPRYNLRPPVEVNY